jgi:predicted ATPase
MRHQRLRSVVVEGFTSIRSATLALNDVNVLVGANGAGKSNFIRDLWEKNLLGGRPRPERG